MLTFFSVPKPFVGPVADAQRNAVESWRETAAGAQVILFGDEAGIAEAAAASGAEHVPAVRRNEFGTPLLDDVFRTAQARARHPLVCYVNADIVLSSDLTAAIGKIAMDRFLAVGMRTDVDIAGRLDAHAIRARARTSGRLHEPTGIDYFLFPRGLIGAMPPFPVGRVLWDNWMIHHARMANIPVIDLTPSVMVVHQNHDYAHVKGGAETVWRGVEAQRNWELVGPDFLPLTIADATFLLDDRGLHPALDARHLLRRALVYPALSPRLRPSVRVARYVWQRLAALYPSGGRG
jgi:hypothetical protein